MYISSILKEIFLFNSFEAMLFLSLYIIDNNIIINNIVGKIAFHILMISILNYIVFNIATIPVIMQLIFLVGMAAYFSIVFHKGLLKSIIVVFKSFIILIIIEVGLAIIFRVLFHIELVSMNDDFQKFIFMIPFRLIEAIGIYGYYRYKLKKRGEITNEKINYNYNQ